MLDNTKLMSELILIELNIISNPIVRLIYLSTISSKFEGKLYKAYFNRQTI